MNEEQRIDWGAVSRAASAKIEKKRRIGPWIAAVLVVLALAAALYSRNGAEKVSTETKEITFPVTRGNLRISVLNRGTVDALNSTDVRCDVEGTSTIISIVPEGTYVNRDDVLVELETGEYKDRLNQQEISFQRAAADLTQASESYSIQKSQNESDITAASLELEFAEVDLKKYVEGEWPQQEAKAKADVAIASEELNRAQDKLNWTEKLYERGFATRSELEADRLAYNKRLLDAEQAKLALEVLLTHTHPKELRKLEAARDEAKRKLERVQSKAASEIAQKYADLQAKEATFRLQEEQLLKLKAQLKNSEIRAPSPGLVVYSSSRNDRGWDEGERIQEGAKVRYRQNLISLPDISKMVVNTKIHESEVSRVQPGQRAEVRLDSQPEVAYWGTVQKVAILPDSNQRWFMPDSRVYNTQVILDGTNTEMRPGKAAQVEIIIDELEDVLYVPNQAVTAVGNQQVCYVATALGSEQRPVVTGPSNSKFIVIESGLKEGEQVLLYPPMTPPEGSPLAPWTGEEESRDPGRPADAPRAPGGQPAAPPDEVAEAPQLPLVGGAIPSSTQPSEAPDGMGPGRRGNLSEEQRAEMRRQMEERMSTMTPEEREALRRRMEERGARRGPRPEGAALPPGPERPVP